MEWRGKPQSIRCDNGPEYISSKLHDWAKKQNINLQFIQPGKPQQNAYIERFNRTVRHELLNMHLFEAIEEIETFATNWLWQYNNNRPHMALNGVTPIMKLKHSEYSTDLMH